MLVPRLHVTTRDIFPTPSINELQKHTNSNIYAFNFAKLFDNLAEKKFNIVKDNVKKPAELKNDDLLICSLTVLGFSLNYKFWCKFLDL